MKKKTENPSTIPIYTGVGHSLENFHVQDKQEPWAFSCQAVFGEYVSGSKGQKNSHHQQPAEHLLPAVQMIQILPSSVDCLHFAIAIQGPLLNGI